MGKPQTSFPGRAAEPPARLAGSLGKLAQQAVGSVGAVGSALHSIVEAKNLSLAQLLIFAMLGIIGVLAAACTTQAVMRLRQEECAGAAEMILATPVSRIRRLLDYRVLGTVSTVLVLLSGAGPSALGVSVSGADPSGGIWMSCIAGAACHTDRHRPLKGPLCRIRCAAERCGRGPGR